MSERVIKGIVLKSFDFQDFDKIVTIYSDKFGKMSFIALGVNKPTSKNMYSLNSFSFSEFEIFKSRSVYSLSKLKTGRLLESNLGLTKIYNNYLFASIISTIMLQEQHFIGKNYTIYKMLEKSINNIANNKNPFSNLVWFIFYILKFLGGEWDLSKCYVCNQKNRIYRRFDFSNYGLVCANCFDPSKEKKQSVEFIDYLMNLQKNTFNSIFHEKMNVAYEIILLRVLLTYLKDEIGIFSKSIDELLAKEIYREKEFVEYTYNVLTN
ncbi:DNA repair protein RecO [Mesoplasma corruscae]|uniref:DNA repair protein RecO n=1 Tax=Mesoplasma corruscae TaxID=216874 RepID=A0A2S5RGE8_9MOLU|nr:DNA repair protein RecO [Mesoplasma corruscae]PPE06409.1 DNA repair protein recO [Mesoplasma corruscae]